MYSRKRGNKYIPRLNSKEENDIDINSNIIDENKNNAEARSNDQNIIKINNESKNSIGQSGNSDVDLQVDIHVDTTAIGIAILCSLLATKQMSNVEFEEAVKRLEEITKKKDVIFTDENNLANVKIFKKR
ncbi:hypothetical protein KHA94_18435 [Bacillus sp. FJAT-49705]|uniref:Uncharacterized protein n=1 Tax=Cytobacillus citreus TaxID=2833586 RepID=A0ABS5NWF4_9BACI|nr:hypothetical protein [Cytobacillus citreus]MBS4192147.1 hypothetical protein [Cytobacillus citreus]